MAKRQDWIIIERLGAIILKNVEGHVFEIGIGFSTPLLGGLADDFDRDLYCFDSSEYRCNWAKFLGYKVFKGKSLANINKLSEVTIAMGLIDGRHKANTVRAEVSFFLERLSVGGVIFLHDTYRQTSPLLRTGENLYEEKMIGDVYKVRKELESLDNVQTFTWPYTATNCGLTMVMKMDPNRPYYEV
jgi:hypothetical protein